jgi:GxxExxY protein
MANPNESRDDPDTYAIIGAAMEVHRVLGCGFLEGVYRASLVIELQLRSIPVAREVPFRVHYKGQALPMLYRADLVCFDSIVVEIKAAREVGVIEQAQAINYLRASQLRRALVLNFGTTSLVYRRYIFTPVTSRPAGASPVADE